jgi:hypothetical protein
LLDVFVEDMRIELLTRVDHEKVRPI